jgi:hypothetical protein
VLQSGYSFGARQTVARMFNNTPGYVITAQHVGNYQEQLALSKFCLAPAGWGWGGRMKVALMHGCVPVIVQVSRWCRCLGAADSTPAGLAAVQM